MGTIWSKLSRAVVYLATAILPIIGAYDYGTRGQSEINLWELLLVSVVVAAVVAAIGEASVS